MGYADFLHLVARFARLRGYAAIHANLQRRGQRLKPGAVFFAILPPEKYVIGSKEVIWSYAVRFTNNVIVSASFW
jgi:hypothetical protein